MQLSDREKKLLAELEAEEERAIKEQQSLPKSDRVQPMPSSKTDFPIGFPNAESADEPNAG